MGLLDTLFFCMCPPTGKKHEMWSQLEADGLKNLMVKQLNISVNDKLAR